MHVQISHRYTTRMFKLLISIETFAKHQKLDRHHKFKISCEKRAQTSGPRSWAVPGQFLAFGPMVLWSCGPLGPRSSGPVVPWSWFSGALVLNFIIKKPQNVGVPNVYVYGIQAAARFPAFPVVLTTFLSRIGVAASSAAEDRRQDSSLGVMETSPHDLIPNNSAEAVLNPKPQPSHDCF